MDINLSGSLLMYWYDMFKILNQVYIYWYILEKLINYEQE